jgi:hypothetical protein
MLWLGVDRAKDAKLCKPSEAGTPKCRRGRHAVRADYVDLAMVTDGLSTGASARGAGLAVWCSTVLSAIRLRRSWSDPIRTATISEPALATSGNCPAVAGSSACVWPAAGLLAAALFPERKQLATRATLDTPPQDLGVEDHAIQRAAERLQEPMRRWVLEDLLRIELVLARELSATAPIQPHPSVPPRCAWPRKRSRSRPAV